jgi:hypothetical protein
MAITKTDTANNILNRVAVEVGVTPIVDPYGSVDATFVKLRYLLNTAGEELCMAYPWEFLQMSANINSVDDVPVGDKFPLPADFLYIINQTGWDTAKRVPIGGPLSPQDWTQLKGRNLAQNTIYASYRITDGQIAFFPTPTGVYDYDYEYISKNWVISRDDPNVRQDDVLVGEDIVLFDKTLVTRYLKTKLLESSGFDSSKAQDDLNQTFSFLTGFDQAAPILSAGRSGGIFPYISIFNVPDTGYGF